MLPEPKSRLLEHDACGMKCVPTCMYACALAIGCVCAV